MIFLCNHSATLCSVSDSKSQYFIFQHLEQMPNTNKANTVRSSYNLMLHLLIGLNATMAELYLIIFAIVQLTPPETRSNCNIVSLYLDISEHPKINSALY